MQQFDQPRILLAVIAELFVSHSPKMPGSLKWRMILAADQAKGMFRGTMKSSRDATFTEYRRV
jgi:hypothetical protein